MKRVLNFYPGPSALPIEVLEEARDELLDWNNTGMSVTEISHRSKEYEQIHNETQELFKELFLIPDNYKVLLLQGGASLQFAMVPLNLIHKGETASYVITGRFAKNAFKSAGKIARVYIGTSTEENGTFYRIPSKNEIKIEKHSAYCHITSNNTIYGTQWKDFPSFEGTPLVVDMSSDIFSRKIDFTPIGLIYAGAQKNLGPAGLTVIIIRNDLIERSKDDLPDILSYKTHASKNSLFNTPPCFAIYIMNKVLKWAKRKGGLDFIEKQNNEKAKLVYGMIDSYPEFFITKVEKKSRSNMNIVFRLPSEDLEKKMLEEAQKEGIIGLKGHRSVGGIRISMYNANGIKEIKTLVNFLEHFYRKST